MYNERKNDEGLKRTFWIGTSQFDDQKYVNVLMGTHCCSYCMLPMLSRRAAGATATHQEQIPTAEERARCRPPQQPITTTLRHGPGHCRQEVKEIQEVTGCSRHKSSAERRPTQCNGYILHTFFITPQGSTKIDIHRVQKNRTPYLVAHNFGKC